MPDSNAVQTGWSLPTFRARTSAEMDTLCQYDILVPLVNFLFPPTLVGHSSLVSHLRDLH